MGINKPMTIILAIVLFIFTLLYITKLQYPHVIRKIGAEIKIDTNMDVNMIHETLEKYNYDIPADNGRADDKTIYVMSSNLNSSKITVSKYMVKNNHLLSISFQKDALIIVSLHSNATIPYTWSYSKETENIDTLKYIDSMELTPPVTDKPEPGVNSNRTNYYFKTVETGSCLLQFHYDRTDQDKYKPDEFYFDLRVQVQ
ncbi:MAG TPA: protease inhibitor I42 family protein [Candidatus Nitrosocosmicus sp.]|nr:protease inhibitor I42 family protein [Candidatus Nitrosocosmicus sp.]